MEDPKKRMIHMAEIQQSMSISGGHFRGGCALFKGVPRSKQFLEGTFSLCGPKKIPIPSNTLIWTFLNPSTITKP